MAKRIKTGRRSVKIPEFEDALHKVIENFGDQATEACNDAVKAIGETAAKVTADNAPVYNPQHGESSFSGISPTDRSRQSQAISCSLPGIFLSFSSTSIRVIDSRRERPCTASTVWDRYRGMSKSFKHWAEGEKYVKKHWEEIFRKQFE